MGASQPINARYSSPGSVRPERAKRGHNHNYGAVAGLVAER